MRKTFKYRADIDYETENNVKRWLSECCFVYNYMLDKRKRDKISRYDTINLLPDLKKRFEELKIVNSQVLQNVCERLDEAYKLFFLRFKNKANKAGFPRFRGRDRYDSFTLKQTGYTLVGSKLYIKNIGVFNLKMHRQLQGDIKTITILRSKTGKYNVCFSCDNVPEKKLLKTNNSVGIDLGLTKILADSNGNKAVNPKYFKRSQDLLAYRQQKLSKCVKGSNNRAKARLLVAKAYEKIHNQRMDFIHKITRKYINDYDIICLEDLKTNNMIYHKKDKDKINLNKHILDSAWSKILEIFKYKAEEAGRKIILVNPRNTSKMCSKCKKIVEKTLHDRMHICPYCGLVIDRDINAAINILWLGTSLDQYCESNVEQKPTCFSSG